MKKAGCIQFMYVVVVLTLFVSALSMSAERKSLKGGPRILKPAEVTLSGNSVNFNVNQISTYIRNNGSFNRDPGTGNAGFEWPRGSGNTANYASGIWLGGSVGGQARVAVAEYSYEYDAGPLAAGINPDDQKYRVYKLKPGDNALTNPDYAEWPFDDGAPALKNSAGGDSLDGSGNRIPEIIGDMTIWCVFNDNNPVSHSNMNTLPLGLEVQLQAFAFNRSDALGNTIFYKWKIINKGGNLIDNAYVTVWTDVDLGNSGDDYDGCDTTLGIGFTYNSAPVDGVYGAKVPATGFDFLQGPIVPSVGDVARYPDGRVVADHKFLKMTSFLKYSNDATDLGNPANGQEVLNYMAGKTRSGVPITDDLGRPTTFMYPGDPNFAYDANTNWIENGAGGDRRFMMSAGPFTMAVGDTQEIVAGNLIAAGADYHNSVTALKQADDLVQTAYDLNFKLAPPPPSPTVVASGLSNQIVLSWGEEYAKDNLIESYVVPDPIAGKAGVLDSIYEFEGYSIYQLENTSGANPKLIATYDRTNSTCPLQISDQFTDPTLGTVYGVVKVTTNSGISRSISLTKDKYSNGTFLNNKDYYFAVTAWAYNDSSIPKIIESAKQVIVVRAGGAPGKREATAYGDTILSTHTGPGDGNLLGIVVNPREVNGHSYTVTFDTITAGVVAWNLDDVTTGTRRVTHEMNQSGDGAYPVVDGIMFKVLGAANDVKDFWEVANAAGPHAPTQGTFLFNGSGFPSTICPDIAPPCDRPTANVGGSHWGIATGAGGIAGDPSYATFVFRVFRGGGNFPQFVPYDFEIRFTPAGGKAFLGFATVTSVIDVPFEIWNTGIATPNDPSDDYRMIPWVNDVNANGIFDLDGDDHPISGGDNDPETDWIYWYSPTNRAPGSGGYTTEFVNRGAAYDGTDGAGNDHIETMARMVIVDWNGGSVSDPTFPANCIQPLPETGTIIRIMATKPNQAFLDAYTINTANYKPTTNSEAVQEDINKIMAVPNPYFGTNAYEKNQFDRVVRFTNLPQKATLRIFNLAGELVRRLDKDDNTSTIDWDLLNKNELPVGSGMYIVHIDMADVGTKVLKVAVIMSEERLNNF